MNPETGEHAAHMKGLTALGRYCTFGVDEFETLK
jgi:hypothetical protein